METEDGLIHYFQVLRRGWWVIVLTVGLATGVVGVLSTRQAPLYRSSADVFLSTENLAAIVSNVQLPSADPVRAAATQASLARNPAVASWALRLSGLTDRTAQSLLSNSSVAAATGADILTFAVSDRNPRIAERLAQDYATAYTQYRRQLDTTAIAGARRGIETQLAQLRDSGNQSGAVYANLYEKDQELKTLQALQGSNALLVRSAGRAVQTQPRPLRDCALAAALGLLLGVGLAVLRDALNTRVRTVDELQSRLDLPQLGRVPQPNRRLRAENELVMLTKPLSAAAEPYRILATNLDFVNLERGARTIMFTSAVRGEGKSTTVANLAVALARGGRRVVLVDLDLRRPSVAHFFSLNGARGLTSVVVGHAELDDVVESIPLVEARGTRGASGIDTAASGSLRVLPVGLAPPNPSEFVRSHALVALLAALRAEADIVLADAPPLLNLSDTMTLSANIEGLVVVARLPLLKRSTLQELRRVLNAAPAAKLGFVATGATASSSYRYEYEYEAEDGRPTRGLVAPDAEVEA